MFSSKCGLLHASERREVCARETTVTLKIERLAGRHGKTLKLIGRIRAEHLPVLKRQIAASAPSALELKEGAPVDGEAVCFLGTWSRRAFISNIDRHTLREWIIRERGITT
jgi:hypothetical protein